MKQQNPVALIAVGAAMLIVGILVGYFGRPLVAQQTLDYATRQAVPTMESTEEPAEATEAEPTEPAAPAEAEPTEPAAPAEAEPTEPAEAEPTEPAEAEPTEPAEAEPTEPAEAEPTEPAEAEAAENSLDGLMTALVAETRHFRGEPDAPVTVIEFSDFRCHFCNVFFEEAGQQIEETYIEEGLVRLGYHHAAYQGEQSILAAEASECAAAQDAFWRYHDYLFAVSGEQQFTRDNLQEFARELDLDTEAFNTCMESGEFSEVVLGETARAQTIGIRGTPSFLINGEPLVGAQPYENFEQVIEAALAEANGASDAETETTDGQE
jgi:protein-disulfide isomerase